MKASFSLSDSLRRWSSEAHIRFIHKLILVDNSASFSSSKTQKENAIISQWDNVLVQSCFFLYLWWMCVQENASWAFQTALREGITSFCFCEIKCSGNSEVKQFSQVESFSFNFKSTLRSLDGRFHLNTAPQNDGKPPQSSVCHKPKPDFSCRGILVQISVQAVTDGFLSAYHQTTCLCLLGERKQIVWVVHLQAEECFSPFITNEIHKLSHSNPATLQRPMNTVVLQAQGWWFAPQHVSLRRLSKTLNLKLPLPLLCEWVWMGEWEPQCKAVEDLYKCSFLRLYIYFFNKDRTGKPC